MENIPNIIPFNIEQLKSIRTELLLHIKKKKGFQYFINQMKEIETYQ